MIIEGRKSTIIPDVFYSFDEKMSDGRLTAPSGGLKGGTSMAIESTPTNKDCQRLGVAKDKFKTPTDIDLYNDEIEQLFYEVDERKLY